MVEEGSLTREESMGQKKPETRVKEPEPSFDVEKEISNKDWNAMKGELEKLRKKEDWLFFMAQAAEMKTLFPDRADELDANDKIWEEIKRKLDESRMKRDWGFFVAIAEDAKILFSEKIQEAELGRNVWAGAGRILGQNRRP